MEIKLIKLTFLHANGEEWDLHIYPNSIRAIESTNGYSVIVVDFDPENRNNTRTYKIKESSWQILQKMRESK